jgi:hypothetical protein
MDGEADRPGQLLSSLKTGLTDDSPLIIKARNASAEGIVNSLTSRYS